MAAATCRVLQSAQMGVTIFLLDYKEYLFHFSNKICRDRIRKNEGIYTQKEKTMDLRTMPTFFSAIILDNTT